jgi:hypothetical protein
MTISDSMNLTHIPQEVSPYSHVGACKVQRAIPYSGSKKNASPGLSDLEALDDEGSMLFQNAVNQLLTDTMSHPRRKESSTTML